MWTVDKILSFTVQVGDCKEWVRCFNTDGYPRIGPNIKVHRLLYQLLSGVDIVGKVVMHTCGNKKCLNPDHLTLGTFDDNNKDRANKDRSYRTVLKGHVDLIKSLPRSMKNSEVAKIVGLDSRRVSEIRSGKRGFDGRIVKQQLL